MCRSKAGQNRRAQLRLPIPRHDDGRGILLHDGMVLESPALLNRCSLPHSGRFFSGTWPCSLRRRRCDARTARKPLPKGENKKEQNNSARAFALRITLGRDPRGLRENVRSRADILRAILHGCLLRSNRLEPAGAGEFLRKKRN
jgi:hypothetical protein